MNPRILLALIATILVFTAVGGVVSGLTSIDTADTPPQPAEPGVVQRDLPETGTTDTDDAPVSPAQPENDAPDDFIRFGTRDIPARTPGTVRLATYNVENLFDDQDDPTLTGRNEDIDDTKPEPHVRALANTIRALDADIIALQEIESEEVLLWFRDTYLVGLGYDHVAAVDAGDDRGIEQAVLSRYPIESVTNWPRLPLGGVHPDEWGNSENWNAGQPITFHRSPLRVAINIPPQSGTDEVPAGIPDAYQLTLYVVHAKSGRPGEYWRVSEARGLVNQINQQLADDPDANIAVLGDFNAFLSDESVQAIITTATLTDALADVADRSPRFMTHESGRRIDHILVNNNLQPEIVTTSPFVLGTPSLPEGVDWRQDWRPDGYASDHFPVVLELTPRDR